MLRLAWLATVAVAAGVAGTAAHADTYRLQYTTFDDGVFAPVSVDALLTTGGGLYAGDPGVEVLAVSGTRGGLSISGPTETLDEVYPDQTPVVDSFGFSFTSGAYTYNFYNDGSNDGVSYHEFATLTDDPNAPGEGRLIADAAVTLTRVPTSAAPEPGAWMLMAVGVGLAGAALRRRRAAWAFG